MPRATCSCQTKGELSLVHLLLVLHVPTDQKLTRFKQWILLYIGCKQTWHMTNMQYVQYVGLLFTKKGPKVGPQVSVNWKVRPLLFYLNSKFENFFHSWHAKVLASANWYFFFAILISRIWKKCNAQDTWGNCRRSILCTTFSYNNNNNNRQICKAHIVGWWNPNLRRRWWCV